MDTRLLYYNNQTLKKKKKNIGKHQKHKKRGDNIIQIKVTYFSIPKVLKYLYYILFHKKNIQYIRRYFIYHDDAKRKIQLYLLYARLYKYRKLISVQISTRPQNG